MKKTFVILTVLASSLSNHGQEALWSGAGPVVSPQINDDNSVTFRYVSPSAKSVKVTGDFLPKVKVVLPHGEFEAPGSSELIKGDNGIWTYTTPPLDPELYLYNFIVDSITTLDPLNLYVNRDITSLTNRLLVPGDISRPYDENNDLPHGTVLKTWYNSPSLGINRRLTIYTPAGYENSAESYPVLYLLHGMGGDENAWLENGRMAQIMDWLITNNMARPMIVVAPNGNPRMQISPADGSLLNPAPQMSEYQVVDGSFESSFPEIVEFIDKNFRTKANKSNRAIAGLSMGGFHSLTISKEFPDLFDYVGLFSAATYRALKNGGFVKKEVPEIYKNFEDKIKHQFNESPALYWIGIGSEDFLYDGNTEFRKMLDDNGLNYEYFESEGGHTWRNWRNYLKIFAPKLFN